MVIIFCDRYCFPIQRPDIDILVVLHVMIRASDCDLGLVSAEDKSVALAVVLGNYEPICIVTIKMVTM